mmetsp:Transcript_1292/g.1934  ORF Transcript_1292/g.1934 Transcript_1292/m.1934 type:complete len:182 (-) Transcript_1292:208-753(-)
MTELTIEQKLFGPTNETFSSEGRNTLCFETNKTEDALHNFDDISSLQSFCSSLRTFEVTLDFGNLPTTKCRSLLQGMSLSPSDIRLKSLLAGTIQQYIDCHLTNSPVSKTREKSKDGSRVPSKLNGMTISIPKNDEISSFDYLSAIEVSTASIGTIEIPLVSTYSPKVKSRTLLVGKYDFQ